MTILFWILAVIALAIAISSLKQTHHIHKLAKKDHNGHD